MFVDIHIKILIHNKHQNHYDQLLFINLNRWKNQLPEHLSIYNRKKVFDINIQ